MSLEKIETQKESANEKMPVELRLQTYSPRASVAISFLESLRWLKKKLGVLFERRTSLQNKPAKENAVKLSRELRVHAARSKSQLHRSF